MVKTRKRRRKSASIRVSNIRRGRRPKRKPDGRRSDQRRLTTPLKKPVQPFVRSPNWDEIADRQHRTGPRQLPSPPSPPPARDGSANPDECNESLRRVINRLEVALGVIRERWSHIEREDREIAEVKIYRFAEENEKVMAEPGETPMVMSS